MKSEPIRQFHAEVKREVVAAAISEGLGSLYRLLSGNMPTGEETRRLDDALKTAWDEAKAIQAELELDDAKVREAEAELLQREADVTAAERAAARGRS